MFRDYLVAQSVKNLTAVQETWVQSLHQEDPLKKEIATHSSIFAWEFPWSGKRTSQSDKAHPWVKLYLIVKYYKVSQRLGTKDGCLTTSIFNLLN